VITTTDVNPTAGGGNPAAAPYNGVCLKNRWAYTYLSLWGGEGGKAVTQLYCNLWEYWQVKKVTMPSAAALTFKTGDLVQIYNAYQNTYLTAPSNVNTQCTGTKSGQNSDSYFKVTVNADGSYSFQSVYGTYLQGGVNY
jgi:hypothetical protein